jgi:endonuclease YncB( thermonuclease family)
MPLHIRRWIDTLKGTSLGLDRPGAGSPFGGSGGVTIPRKWFIAGAVVIGCCFIALLGAIAVKAIFPGPTRGERQATATAAFATVVQENLATFRAQPRPTVPSSTPVLAGTEMGTSAAAVPAIETVPPGTTGADEGTPTGVSGASCIPNNPRQTAKVVEVVDGDTIKVLLDADGQTSSVRYIGMDTPEMNPPGLFMASEAKARNAQLTAGKTVTMIRDVSEVDRYDRLLRYVLVDNIFVNYALVAEGYARAASYPPDIACIPTFKAAEQQASAAGVGLWFTSPTLIPLPTAVRSGSSGAACDCTGPDLDCADLVTHANAQACYEACIAQGYGDVFRLDGDGNGQACEALP